MLTRLDRALSAATLRAGALSEKHAWRLGRWARRAAAAAHEGMLRVAVTVGATSVRVALVRESQRSEPAAVPDFPLLLAPIPGVSRRARELAEGPCTPE